MTLRAAARPGRAARVLTPERRLLVSMGMVPPSLPPLHRPAPLLLALLGSGCGIDLAVASGFALEEGRLEVLQTWGNASLQEPWTTQWGVAPVLTGQIIDPTGTIRVDDAAGAPTVAVSMRGANEVGAAFGQGNAPVAALLDGEPGALAPALELPGSGAGPAFLGLSASVDGWAACGRLRGGPSAPLLDGPTSGFHLVGDGAAVAHAYELSGDTPLEVLPLAAVRRDAWSYLAGAYYNQSLGQVTLDGEVLPRPTFFPDDGPDHDKSYPMLLAFELAEPENVLALGLDNEPGPGNAALGELRAVDAGGTRIVAAGRTAGFLTLIEASGTRVVISDVARGIDPTPDDFMPVLVEVARQPGATANASDFEVVWHHVVASSGTQLARGELGAVRILEGGDVLACGSYRGAAPDSACGSDAGGWLVLVHPLGDEGPARCVALGVEQPGVCTSIAQSSDGAIWLGGVGAPNGDAPPRGVLYRLDAELQATARIELGAAGATVTGVAAAADGSAWVVGAFAGALGGSGGGEAPRSAVGGADDWDFFLARWSIP